MTGEENFEYMYDGDSESVTTNHDDHHKYLNNDRDSDDLTDNHDEVDWFCPDIPVYDYSKFNHNEDNSLYENNEEQEHTHDEIEARSSDSDRKGSNITFTGYGRCSCGCGSFVGCGDMCQACHHPYSSHSRYKK